MMKSPFTGGKVTLKNELAELTFRKEKFQYVHQFYECEDSHERFTTTALDEVNVAQVYNQYRAKYGIPFPDEIKLIRQRYDLSASKMAQILGFGDNQYRLYENGDMPSETNGKILMSIMNPQIFKTFVLNARNQLDEAELARILDKVDSVKVDVNGDLFTEYIFNGAKRDFFNGFANQSIDKLKNVLLFYIAKFNGVFFTKMNKLLFYTDFYNYKHTGRGVTGLSYKSIQYGFVPLRWDRIYSFFNDIQQEIVRFESGVEGTKLLSDIMPDMSLFTEKEIESLEKVYERFKSESAASISDISHQEVAWQNYLNSNQMVDYSLSFNLKAM